LTDRVEVPTTRTGRRKEPFRVRANGAIEHIQGVMKVCPCCRDLSLQLRLAYQTIDAVDDHFTILTFLDRLLNSFGMKLTIQNIPAMGFTTPNINSSMKGQNTMAGLSANSRQPRIEIITLKAITQLNA
jgi:hypothetical protein